MDNSQVLGQEGPEIIVWREGEVQARLTFLSSFSYFYRVFQLTIPRELNFLRRDGGVKVYKAL